MSEFKGTKGKWERITSDWDLNQSVFLQDTEKQICLVNSKIHNQIYDALLISKAPEMLEMLKEVLAGRISPREYQSDWELVNELIKSATEVKEDK